MIGTSIPCLSSVFGMIETLLHAKQADEGALESLPDHWFSTIPRQGIRVEHEPQEAGLHPRVRVAAVGGLLGQR